MSSEPIVLQRWGKALCLVAAIILAPLFWTFVALVLIFRLVAYLLTGFWLDNVLGMDALFALETLSPAGMITIMATLDGIPDMLTFRERFEQRLLLAKVESGGDRKRFPKFSRYIQYRMGFPVWCESPEVRVSEHFHEHPGEVGSELELETVVNEYNNRHMEYGRPAFEFIFIRLKNGWRAPHRSDETVPVFCMLFRGHHCYADGVSMVRMMCEILASNSDQMMDTLRSRLGNIKEMRRSVHRRLAISSALLVCTSVFLVPFYYIRLTVARDRGLLRGHKVRTGDKHYCWSSPIPLSRMKAVKTAASAASGSLNVTVNDVVMSCVAGAVRRLLSEREEHVPRRLKAFLPVSTQSLDEPVSESNKLIVLLSELATGVSDPLERVLESKKLVDRIKTSLVDWMMNDLTARISGLLCRPNLGICLHLWAPSLVFSNVPGPSIPIDILGHQVGEAFGFVPHGSHMGLTIAFMSFCDSIVVTVVMDKGLGEDIEVARRVVRDTLHELDLLEDQLHIKKYPAELPIPTILIPRTWQRKAQSPGAL